MSKPWQPYALHILDTMEKLRRIEARGDIRADEILYDAALRNLQTLSEATQRLPEALKAACPEIPWRQIAGFRNVLVHEYLGEIDPQAVKKVMAEHLPDLDAAVRRMLEDHARG